jgi:hypothetical protein
MKLLTPGKTIRKFCLNCSENAGTDDCGGSKQFDGACSFYRYRASKKRPSMKAIREFCLSCMNGHVAMVTNCSSATCPLLPYRMGKPLPVESPQRPPEAMSLKRRGVKSKNTGNDGPSLQKFDPGGFGVGERGFIGRR